MSYKDEVEKLLTEEWKPTTDIAREIHKNHPNYNWTAMRSTTYMALQKLEKYRIAEHKVVNRITYWRGANDI